MHERAGGAEAGMVVGETETLEVEYAQRRLHGVGAGGGLEMVTRKFGHDALLRETGEGVERGFVVRRGAPDGERALREHELARRQRVEHGEEILRRRIAREAEFAGGEVHPGGVQAAAVACEGGEVTVAGGVELVGLERCPRTQDARDGAADESARLGRLGLVADGDLAAGGEDFADVVVGGVERDARHRVAVAPGEGDAEEFGADLGVLEKQLVEIAEAEEEQGVGREAAFHLKVLLQHRRELLVGHGCAKAEGGRRRAEVGNRAGAPAKLRVRRRGPFS